MWTGLEPDKNTGVGSDSLLQGIFLIQGLNLGLPHCRRALYPLSRQDYQTFSLSYSLPRCFIPGDWRYFPVLESRTMLLIHFTCHSLLLPPPKSQSSPPQPHLWISEATLLQARAVLHGPAG